MFVMDNRVSFCPYLYRKGGVLMKVALMKFAYYTVYAVMILVLVPISWGIYFFLTYLLSPFASEPYPDAVQTARQVWSAARQLWFMMFGA